MPIEKVIVLEDDAIQRRNLEQLLRQRGREVVAVDSLARAYDALASESIDLMFVDVRLPDGEGTELLAQLEHRDKKPLAVFMTGYATVESAVECMRNGAFDYLIKPFSADQIEIILKKADDFSQLIKVNRYYSGNSEESSSLLGQSPQMERLRQLIRKVARTQATVLIQGESGTGKELVARAVYRQSPRVSGPFIKVNCAAFPENMIESEFFGHEKGAFTGALTKREGRFELAHRGTILLDEIGEISPAVQAKLLRVLQERELERVGGNRTIKVDVRVIATTNRKLKESVQRKEFRQDLFFRLAVVPVPVPPLRDRTGDIPILAEQFMKQMTRKHGSRLRRMSPDCLAALEAHSWPGNVRELQNVIERGIILSVDDEVMELEHLGFDPSLSLEIPAPKGQNDESPAGVAAALGGGGHGEFRSLAQLEKQQIFAALERTNGNRTHAARLLGISIRTLRNKLHEYGATKREEPVMSESCD